MATTPAPAGRPYGGASAADRVADREHRLVQATLDLVGRGGIESLTVGTICRDASVAKRYFYEGFSSLDELLDRALSDALGRVSAEIVGKAEALADGASIEVLQEVAVRAVLGVFDDARVARLYLESPGLESLRVARDRAVGGFVAQFLELLALEESDRERARLLVHAVVAGTTEVVSMWLRGELALDREEVVATLVELGSSTTRLIERA